MDKLKNAGPAAHVVPNARSSFVPQTASPGDADDAIS
jgi:hypothetical protein